MRKSFPVEDLARDARFVRVDMMERVMRPAELDAGPGRLELAPAASAGSPPTAPTRPTPPAPSCTASSSARSRPSRAPAAPAGTSRSASGNGEGIPEVPFELKLDMARQCWDEARHCEISIKLSGHMGTELGEFSESPFLYQAACNPDPVLRLTGVNRALEGLAIDVFNTMREFGDIAGDPVLEFCEDWMLADEVTHVKMGSDWLRRLTANDKPRQERALEFQRVVDKLFSLGGFRGEEEDSPVRLARRFRELAGFDEAEMDTLAEIAREAREEMQATHRGQPGAAAAG